MKNEHKSIASRQKKYLIGISLLATLVGGFHFFGQTKEPNGELSEKEIEQKAAEMLESHKSSIDDLMCSSHFLSDHEKALIHCTAAANEGMASSQSILGLMYQNALGTERDYVKAFEWYSKAVTQDDAMAQHGLCQLHMNGWGTAKDFDLSFNWCKKAAEQNYAAAQSSLAFHFEEGHGVTQNYQEAFDWYSKAAAQNHAGALFSLGLLHLEGHGVEKNRQKAFELLTKAREHGDIFAHIYLDRIKETSWLYEPPVTLEENSEWRARIEVGCLEPGKECGKIDFRALNCGGKLIYRGETDERHKFDEQLTYGNCVANCSISINAHNKTYSEYCAGNRTGGGSLSLLK